MWLCKKKPTNLEYDMLRSCKVKRIGAQCLERSEHCVQIVQAHVTLVQHEQRVARDRGHAEARHATAIAAAQSAQLLGRDNIQQT